MLLSSEKDLKKVLENVVKELANLVKPPIDKIEIVAYGRGAYPPAHQYYLSALHVGQKLSLEAASQTAIHTLPYRDDIRGILVYVFDVKDKSVLSLAQAASLLEVPIWIYGPPLHPAYEEKLETLDVERVIIPQDYPLILLSLASLEWFINKLPESRRKRLKEETSSLIDSIDWLKERYSTELSRVKDKDIDYILTTFSTYSGAYYLRTLLKSLNRRTPKILLMDELPYVNKGSKVLIFSTSTEEHLHSEVKLEAQVKGLDVIIIKFNTDPLTASIYSMLVSSMITGVII
jgi:hypothetical protein